MSRHGNHEDFRERYPLAGRRKYDYAKVSDVRDRGACKYCGDRLISSTPNIRVCHKPDCKQKQQVAQSARRRELDRLKGRKR